MRIILLLILTAFISGCGLVQKQSNQPPQPQPINRKNETLLKQFVDWKIHGRISLKTLEDTSIISIRWQQNKEDIKLRLYGSMGKTYARLVKKNGVATLTVENKSYTDSNARYLLWTVLGWDLPIDQMQYWIKGITAPGNIESEIQRNDKGLLSSFDYKNWHAEFEQYKNFKSYQLPTKIILTHPKLRIRFSIQSWRNSD
jgi:outer membrane lipoprotein LolB